MSFASVYRCTKHKHSLSVRNYFCFSCAFDVEFDGILTSSAFSSAFTWSNLYFFFSSPFLAVFFSHWKNFQHQHAVLILNVNTFTLPVSKLTEQLHEKKNHLSAIERAKKCSTEVIYCGVAISDKIIVTLVINSY